MHSRCDGRDHLRVCGADSWFQWKALDAGGSSPRVRSRLGDQTADLHGRGIISACAEQTRSSPSGCRLVRDHLRVCGADSMSIVAPSENEGSSPRVRSRRVSHGHVALVDGIISACAEQTT